MIIAASYSCGYSGSVVLGELSMNTRQHAERDFNLIHLSIYLPNRATVQLLQLLYSLNKPWDCGCLALESVVASLVAVAIELPVALELLEFLVEFYLWYERKK